MKSVRNRILLNCQSKCSVELLQRVLLSKLGILFIVTFLICLLVYTIVGIFFPDPRHRFPLASVAEVRKYLDVAPRFKSFVRKRSHYDFTALEYQFSHPQEYRCKILPVQAKDESNITANSDIKCLEKDERLVRQTGYGDLYVKPAEIKNGRPEFRCFYTDLTETDNEVNDKYQLREGKQRIDMEQIKVQCFDQQNSSIFSDAFFTLQPHPKVSNHSVSRLTDKGHLNYTFAFLSLNGISKSDLILRMSQTVDALEKINTHLFNGFHSSGNPDLFNGDSLKMLIDSVKNDEYITMRNTMTSSTFDETLTYDLSQFNKYLMENTSESTAQCSVPVYERTLNVLKRFLSKYPTVPTFSITDINVNGITDLGDLDTYLSNTIDQSYLNGGFENTVFFILGHKPNEQPFMGSAFPRTFFGTNPEKYSVFLKNKNCVVVMDDIYATINDVMGRKVENGVSILQEISIDRDCEGMKIPKENCQCVGEASRRIDDTMFKKTLSMEAFKYVRKTMGSLSCKNKFTINNITEVKHYEENRDVYQASIPLSVSWNESNTALQLDVMFDNKGRVILKPYIKHADSRCTVKTLDQLCHCEPGYGSH